MIMTVNSAVTYAGTYNGNAYRKGFLTCVGFANPTDKEPAFAVGYKTSAEIADELKKLTPCVCDLYVSTYTDKQGVAHKTVMGYKLK